MRNTSRYVCEVLAGGVSLIKYVCHVSGVKMNATPFLKRDVRVRCCPVLGNRFTRRSPLLNFVSL